MISVRRMTCAALATVTSVALTLSTTAVAAAFDLGALGAPTGVDVSGHQHPTIAGIDWNAVKSDGQSYAFVKATEGEGWSNGHFVGDANAAKAAGLKVGAYHYARPSADPRRQAAAFAGQLALVPGQTLPPVLDLEVSEGKSPEELIAWTRTFTDELKRLTGRTPMIYTYRYFWQDHMGNTTQFSEYPLWLAAYQQQAPDPVGGWDRISFWQHSESGRVNGITGPVDLNIFNGNQMQLEAFSAGNYVDIGGVLEGLVLPGGNDLGKDATAIIAVIIALGAGAAAAPALADAARGAGLDAGASQALVDQVAALAKNGALPVGELQNMAKGDYSVGDLAILLDNAAHISGTNVSEEQVNKSANILSELLRNVK